MKTLIALTLWLGLGPAMAAQSPEELLATLRQDLTRVQAQFSQYESLPDGVRQDENSGEVWMASPDKFRWHYRTPVEQLIVADGEKVWIYDEDLQQVTVRQQDNELNPIYVLLDEELTQRNYNLTAEGERDGMQWVHMQPKLPSEEVKSVQLGIEGNALKVIRMTNPFDQIVVFEFKDIQRNPQLKSGLFEFSVPEGVDVIRADAGEIKEF